MDTPVFTDGQFVNAALLNSAVSGLMADFKAIGHELHTPGLLSPGTMIFTPLNLIVQIQMPDPFAVLFGSGLVVGAHGTVNGQDTTTYTVNMASLVPGSGSQLAYIVAKYGQIGENLVTVVGPPQGHPDYNADFSPFQFYETSRDSITIQGTTTAPDNITTFELCRITLTAGQSVIQPNQIDTTHWHYASAVLNPTGVTAGSYTGASITVGADGRLTAASSVAYGPLAGSNTWTGPNSFDEAVSAASFTATANDDDGNGGGFRTIVGNYGVFLQNNGSAAHLVQTASGDQTGGSNAFRPFGWNLSTGAVVIDSTGAGVSTGGSVTVVDPNTAGIIVNGTGSGQGGNIKLMSSAGSKYLRCLGNVFQVVNNAYNAVLSSIDDVGNFTTAGTITSGGAITASSGNITAAGAVTANNGNVTAANGRLLATFGARGSGIGNAATILGDFSQSWTAQNQGYNQWPDNQAMQMQGSTVPAGPGVTTSSVQLPKTFSGGISGAVVCFAGTGPSAATGSICCQPQDNNHVLVSANYPGGTGGPLAITVLAFGHGPLT